MATIHTPDNENFDKKKSDKKAYHLGCDIAFGQMFKFVARCIWGADVQNSDQSRVNTSQLNDIEKGIVHDIDVKDKDHDEFFYAIDDGRQHSEIKIVTS
jgi:hypothetical protein